MDTHPAIPAFRISPSAAAQIDAISTAQGGGYALRLTVEAGGCSGFQYKFDLRTRPEHEDVVIEQGPARVFIDPASLDLLAGSELDYSNALMGAHFTVKNPQAVSSCGCGTSFSVD